LGPPATTKDHYGQLMYYDNSPWDSRMVFLWSSDMYSQGSSGLPDLYDIYTQLPRYIMLSIDEYGNITPSMPSYSATSPHHGNVKGVDYPENGAIVWLTGGNRTDDHVIDLTDNYFAHIFHYTDPYSIATRVNDPYGEYRGVNAVAHRNYDLVNGSPRVDIYSNPFKKLLCDPTLADQYSTACAITDPYTGAWLDSSSYGLVIYSIGYVRGRANKLIRVVYK
jgi:hypothetical protein